MEQNQRGELSFRELADQAKRRASETQVPSNIPAGSAAPQPGVREESFRDMVARTRAAQPGYKEPPPPKPESWVSQETLKRYEPVVAPVSGVAKGLVGAPGVIGNLQSLYQLGVSKAMPYITGEKSEDVYKRLRENPLSMRTSADYIAAAEKALPAIEPITGFKPETKLGRIAQGVGEAVAPAALPGRVGAVLSLGPGGYGQRVATAGGAGAGAETLGEMVLGKEYETGARILGGIAGGVGGAGANALLRARSAPAVTERSERIAGEALREGFATPQAQERAMQTLSTEAAQRMSGSSPYVEGVRPTTAQVLKEPTFGDIERSAVSMAPGSAEAQALTAQRDVSRQALGAEGSQFPPKVDAAIPTVDLAAAFNFAGRNPQNIASQNVRSAVDALESSLDAASKAAWSNPALKQTNYFTKPTVGSIQGYISGLDETKRAAINPRVMETLNTYAESGKKAIPLEAMQSLRSSILDDAREAARKGRLTDWRINTDLGTHIKDVLNNSKNVQFGDKSQTKIKAWNDAVASTRNYYDTFRSDFMAKMIGETKGGTPKVPGDAVFDIMFKGPSAVQNFESVYRVLGPSVHADASSWILGKLTDNGRKLALDQKTVDRFTANPTNAAIIAKIPGLQAKINDLVYKTGESVRETQLRNINTAFEAAINNDNPARLSKFLDANGSILKSVLPPDGQRFIDSMSRSAKALTDIQPQVAPNKKVVEMLSNNSIGGILYGRALGKIPDVLAGEIITFGLGRAADVSVPGAGAVLATTRAGKEAVSGLSDKFTNLLFGPTREQTVELLQRAMRDPDLARMLMQKPSAANIDGVLDALGKTAAAAGRTGITAAPVIGEQINQRQQRKAGGRVMSAQHMVAAADRAKKAISGKTEALLNSTDEHVAKALEIAKQNLEG